MELNNVKEILKKINDNVCVVAATKYVDSKDMLKLIDCGINDFGENRVDSFLQKYEELNDQNIIWHFIGHLQKNKAKKIINKIDYLHSLDSLELAKIINKEREKPLKCFIEVSINEEETKNGVKLCDLEDFVRTIKCYEKIELIGFMCMTIKASNSEEKYLQFKSLANVLEDINKKLNLDMKCLSMGMSDDYEQALKAHATHIRLGRILWKQEM